MPGENVRTILLRLLAAADRVEGFSGQRSLDLQSHYALVEEANSEFLHADTNRDIVRAAENLLQASLNLMRIFEPVNQLCEEITQIQNVINDNIAALQALPQYPLISRTLFGLLNARGNFEAHSPQGLLTDLHHNVGERIDLSTQLEDSLDQGSVELRDWWAIWNSDEPNFNHALQFASNPYQQTAMQLT